MEFSFTKYQGTGNDFVLIDDRDGRFPQADQALVERLCHRRTGIGADGLILLRASKDYDFQMIYFNADGKEGSMCGNGGRCVVRFAHDLGLIESETRFVAVDGEHDARIDASGYVRLHMRDLEVMESMGADFFLNTGSPHYVRFVEQLDALNVFKEGRNIRYGTHFRAEGTNVNFVEEIEGGIAVRTYERGVEDETLSCGTGVTACALVMGRLGYKSPVQVQTKGGALQVEFTRSGDGYTGIYLSGPTERSFAGTFVA